MLTVLELVALLKGSPREPLHFTNNHFVCKFVLQGQLVAVSSCYLCEVTVRLPGNQRRIQEVTGPAKK